jgi:two-component system sensor histidine kinase DesK
VLLYKGIGTPFIFTSAYMAGRLPTGRAIQAVVALALLIAVFGLRDLNWSYLGQGIVLVLVVGIVTISMVRTVTTGRELRAAREEIARLAVMTERLRIARDLHDLLGHNLSLIALKSELAGRLIGVAPERATLSSELHAAHEILFAAGIAYRYEGDESTMGTLPTAVETLLSWAVREGVTNVIRHSRARQCTVRMQRENHSACVEVIDDGVARPQDTASSGGNGLRGLAERVEALDGSFEAGPRLGGGYRLAVSVPVVQSERSDNYAKRSEQR